MGANSSRRRRASHDSINSHSTTPMRNVPIKDLPTGSRPTSKDSQAAESRSITFAKEDKAIKGILSQVSLTSKTKLSKRVSFCQFKGLMAPVFTCFMEDEDCSLQTKYVPRYAKWLKSEGITGVLVNSITGEGPTLGVNERKRNAEAWQNACEQYDLILIVQIGGAPLPDVCELARHAERIGAQGVMCLPDLFENPKNEKNLVKYCAVIAKKCKSTPFFYYHTPLFTNVEINLKMFCEIAEEHIPNFYGILFSEINIEEAAVCLKDQRIIFCGVNSMLAPALLYGFDAIMMSFLNVRPALGFEIYDAVKSNNLKLARKKQKELSSIIAKEVLCKPSEAFAGAMKNWFNKEMFSKDGAGFLLGPTRRIY